MVDRNSLPAMSVVACSLQKGASKYICVCIQVCHSKLLSDIYVIKNCQLIKENLHCGFYFTDTVHIHTSNTSTNNYVCCLMYCLHCGVCY